MIPAPLLWYRPGVRSAIMACPAGTEIMELSHLRARIKRLDQLIRGLRIGKCRWLKCDAPVYRVGARGIPRGAKQGD
jgi:hypothetical protein